MKCRNCNNKKVRNMGSIEEWDYYYTEYKCDRCGNTFLIGDKKFIPTNPKTDPILPRIELMRNSR